MRCATTYRAPAKSRDAGVLRIRRARSGESPVLSRIAFEAKATWGYTAEQMERWRAELTVSGASLRDTPTFVAQLDGRAIGYWQVRMDTQPPQLDQLFVDPRHLRRGVGRRLLCHALDYLWTRGIAHVSIEADPHAEAFYLAMGARRIGALAAAIDGDPLRVRPLLHLDTVAARRRPSIS